MTEPRRQPRGDGSVEELPRMPLLEHLSELRRRLVRAFGAVAAVFGLLWLPLAALWNPIVGLLGRGPRLPDGWRGVDLVFEFLARPIYALLPEGKRLAFLGVTDPFIFYMKVAALAALFIASPVVLYQFWRFVSPGLYSRERRFLVPVVTLSTLFFLGGAAFAYWVAFPFAAEFLLGLGAQFEPVITVDRYMRFLITVLLGLGLMFELPIVLVILARMGVVTAGFLLRQFRWAVLIIFVAAAAITPTPDVVNMCLFALPTIGLYLVGILGAWAVRRRE